MKTATLCEMPHAGSPLMRFDGGGVSGNPRCRRVVKGVLAFAFALTACTVLAKVSGISEKSYFLDTRCPVVSLSDSCELDTTPSGMFILIR